METIPYKLDEGGSREADSEIILKAQQSLAGFKPLYTRWLAPVLRYFRYRVGNVKDAEDLTSQVFLKIYEDLPRYRDQGRFTAWLFTIVRHTAADYFRRRKSEISLETVDPIAETNDPLAQAINTDEMQRLYHLIILLEEDEQELIRLRFVVQLSYREIGEVLGRKEDAIRKTISRLLARLQNQMEVHHE